MAEKIFEELRGRIEIVRVGELISTHCSLGNLNGQEILVSNGNGYEGVECLVKFDFFKRKNLKLLSSFITSNILDGVEEGVSPAEYILIGSWTPEMNKAGKVPTFKEYNRYFNPGSTKYFFYLLEGSTSRRHRVRVNSASSTTQHKSISKIIRDFPDPYEQSRVIITESKKDLEMVVGKVEELGLRPVEMEPLG